MRSKHESKGDYHWRDFKKDTPYREHVLFVEKWVAERHVLDVGWP